MYPPKNISIDECLESINGQMALNVNFIDRLFKSQQDWTNQVFDQQQKAQATFVSAKGSTELDKVSKSSQAFTLEITQSWLSCCNNVVKAMQDFGSESVKLQQSLAETNIVAKEQASNLKAVAKSETVASAPAKKSATRPAEKKSAAKPAQVSQVKTVKKVSPKAAVSGEKKAVAKVAATPVKKPVAVKKAISKNSVNTAKPSVVKSEAASSKVSVSDSNTPKR